MHQYLPHDHDQPWGANPGGPEAVIAGVTAARGYPGASVRPLDLDLSEPGAPAQLIDAAGQAFVAQHDEGQAAGSSS